MAESILTSTKATLGLPAEHTAFDAELIVFINSVLSRLTQLGVGPKTGYRITGAGQNWEDILGDDLTLNMVKSYMHGRVKLMFDPPQIGFVLTMMKDQIDKDETLINWLVEAQELPSEVGEEVTLVLDGGEP